MLFKGWGLFYEYGYFCNHLNKKILYILVKLHFIIIILFLRITEIHFFDIYRECITNKMISCIYFLVVTYLFLNLIIYILIFFYLNLHILIPFVCIFIQCFRYYEF